MAAKMKRKTLSDVASEVTRETPERPRASGSGKKVRATFHLPDELVDRLRDAVYWTPGLTLAGLAEEALTQRLAELEADRGEPFPKRKGELKGGRPVK